MQFKCTSWKKLCKRKLSNRAAKAAAQVYSEESTDARYISYLSHCCDKISDQSHSGKGGCGKSPSW